MRTNWVGRPRKAALLVASLLLLLWPAWSHAEEWKRLQGHKAKIWCIALSADNALLASGDDEGLIRLWDVASAKQIAVLKDGFSRVHDIIFLKDGKTLLTSSRQ